MQARILLCGKAVNPSFVRCTKFNARMPAVRFCNEDAQKAKSLIGTGSSAIYPFESRPMLQSGQVRRMGGKLGNNDSGSEP
jgi:hypothetical protein